MPRTTFQELLDNGCHFGHLARKWNPKMAPYIFIEKNGIHIIDLHKSIVKIDEAAGVLKQLARSGRKVLFDATKKQAKDIVAEKAAAVGMPYVTERWAGGMLTNFPTIRKAVKKMNTIDKMKEDGTYEKLAKRERLQIDRQRAKLEKNLGSIRDMSRLPSAIFVIDKMKEDGTYDTLAKRERLQIDRQRAKLEKNLGSIKDMNRLPSALFVIDVQKEANAVKEAVRLNIPVIAMVDTCCDPTPIDYVIPANDDATKSIAYIMDVCCQAINEGLEERKLEKDKEPVDVEEEKAAPAGVKLRSRKNASSKLAAAKENVVEAAPAAEAPAAEEAKAE